MRKLKQKNGWSGNDVNFYPGTNGILQSKLTKQVLNHITVHCQLRDEHLASSDKYLRSVSKLNLGCLYLGEGQNKSN